MFKKIFLILTALIFALGILATSVYHSAQSAVVKNFKLVEFEAKSEEEATPEAKEPIEYPLTYPGILPDHFLYPVKMIRDRIWLFLTTDPLKKAELLLKFADKRIWSAQMLVEKEEIDLGVSTATKAEKYLEQAVNQEKAAREKGKDTIDFLEKLSKATLKHEEILLGVREKITDSARPVIDDALEYPRRGYEQVIERLGK